MPYNEFPEAQQWTLELELLIPTASHLKSSALLKDHSAAGGLQPNPYQAHNHRQLILR